jgi:hypothetical protein
MRETATCSSSEPRPGRPPAHGLSADLAAIDMITDALITP